MLSNPANRHRAVPLTFEQFRFGFGNAVSEEEAKNPERGPMLTEFAVIPGRGHSITVDSGWRAVADTAPPGNPRTRLSAL